MPPALGLVGQRRWLLYKLGLSLEVTSDFILYRKNYSQKCENNGLFSVGSLYLTQWRSQPKNSGGQNV